MLEDCVRELSEARIEMMKSSSENPHRREMIFRRMKDAYLALSKMDIDEKFARSLSDNYIFIRHVCGQSGWVAPVMS